MQCISMPQDTQAPAPVSAPVPVMPDEPEPTTTELHHGFGFHLGPDGKWLVEQVPDFVVRTAKFSGYLTVLGYRSAVFETPEGEMWAQKVTVSVASRIASRWLRAQKDEDEGKKDEKEERVAQKPAEDALDYIESVKSQISKVDIAFEHLLERLAEIRMEIAQTPTFYGVKDSVTQPIITGLSELSMGLEGVKMDQIRDLNRILSQVESEAKKETK